MEEDACVRVDWVYAPASSGSMFWLSGLRGHVLRSIVAGHSEIIALDVLPNFTKQICSKCHIKFIKLIM
jgi:hypothetical protein